MRDKFREMCCNLRTREPFTAAVRGDHYSFAVQKQRKFKGNEKTT